MTSIPLVDEQNPLYCSHLLVSSFTANSDANISLPTFFRKLTGNPDSRQNMEPSNCNATIEQTIVDSRHQASNDMPRTPPTRSGLELSDQSSSPSGQFPSSLDGSGPARKRARIEEPSKETSDDLELPDSDWERLCEIIQQSSESSPSTGGQECQPEEERTRVIFEADGDEQVQPEDDIDSEGKKVYTRTLLLRLDEVFPGKGLREGADAFKDETEQDLPANQQGLIDLLGERGALNEKGLTALRGAEIRKLDLGPTMCGINELSFPRGNVMQVLSKPGWFNHLDTLSFAGGRFQDDFDLVQIQSLRQLKKLDLANTGIGNEGVFYIISLKHTLEHLDLSGNHLINDDVIPALIILENLRYLSITGTSVTMPGLRKLAGAMKQAERVFEVHLPSLCQRYMDGIHTHYLVQPAPPLISDPSVCPMLSKTALSGNLAAHAAINPTICSTGTRKELEDRLARLLELRRLDLVVREILCREIVRN